VISPILKISLSFAMIDLKEGLAFGPKIMGALVFFDRVRCPLIKSA
jgi:hypothetical protein